MSIETGARICVSCSTVECPGRGRGVVATRSIAPGGIVLTFSGPVLRFEEIRDFTHVLEFAPGRFLGPSGDLDDLVNHSCDPNCVLESDGVGARLRALRRIRRGEELTYDYSTAMLTDPTTFACACGSAGCRGVVRGWDELASEQREEFLRRGVVPAFVAARTRRRGEPASGR